MSGTSDVQRGVVKKALSEFPETPTKTLARKIYEEHPLLFSSLEATRKRIRYFRGNCGHEFRKALGDQSFVRPNATTTNPFDDIPEGLKDFNDWTSFQLPHEKTLLLADVHIPYHDTNALKIALRDGKHEGCTSVFLNGDFADFFALSFFDKDPSKKKFQNELDTIEKVLDIINRDLKPSKIYYKLGNHEDRLIRYLRVKAPEIFNLRILRFEDFIHADNHNVETIKDKRIVKFGEHLNIIHGHEFGGDGVFSPVNPARGLYMRAKVCALAGHNHQTSQHTEVSMDGKVIATWSVGCLCDLHPEYKPINKWNHGYAIIEPIGDDGFQVKNKKIIEGKIYT